MKPADKRTATGWGIAYIVLIPVGAVVCGGLAVLFFVKKKKDKTEEKKNGVRLCSQILTLVFAFTVLAGTGIFGVSGLLEERHNPLYYYAGRDREQKRCTRCGQGLYRRTDQPQSAFHFRFRIGKQV